MLTSRRLLNGINQSHTHRAIGPDGFKHGKGLVIIVDVILQFTAAVANVVGVDENGRNARVDHGCFKSADAGYFKIVHYLSRWEH